MLSGPGANLDFVPKCFEELLIGDTAWCQRSFNEADVVKFSSVTGIYATPYLQSQYVPDIQVASMISTVLGMKLPGPGSAVELDQKMEFLAPIGIGETITARVNVIEKLPEHQHISLRITCTNQQNILVLDGTVRMKMLMKNGKEKP